MGHTTEEEEETGRFDLGPWAHTPSSSRVEAYRYDYLNRATQVTWRNNKNIGYIYEDMPYEAFRSFARAASKGKHINASLNGFPYRLMDPDEVQAPSNERRTGLQSRVRA
jgi:KTSC domain